MNTEINAKWKNKIDEIFSKQIWEVEESCFQELYGTIIFNLHYGFCHNGHEYFITTDVDKEKNPIWVIYDRDFSDSKVAYKTDWDIEPRSDFPDIPSLVFGFKLKNDGRTIAEYCCDFWNQPRILVPEPINENLARKIWRH